MHSSNQNHFTGTKAGKPIRRKGLMRKQRLAKRNKSVNKYAHLVPKRQIFYDPIDKTFRDLPVMGNPGEVLKAGFRVTFHGRLYGLLEDITIPAIDEALPKYPGVPAGKNSMIGKFKLV